MDTEEIQEIFSNYCDSGSTITGSQIGEVLRATGLNPTESEIAKFVGQVASTSQVTFDQFLPMYHGMFAKKNESKTYAFEEMAEGLRQFDIDCTGFIPASELRHMLMALGEKLTEDEVDLILEGNIDSEGKVNYENLVKHIMAG